MDELLNTVPLTPDISRANPNLYRSKLIYLLDRNTKYGSAALNFVIAHRNVSRDKITFNSEKWQSAHDEEAGSITLGTTSMTPEEKAVNFPFETNSFNDEKIMLYKLTHELCHLLGEAIADEIEGRNTNPHLRQYEALMRYFASLREKGKGMSSHAGNERYIEKGAGIQAVEDMTDLMAFHLMDPGYLDRYLQFLVDPQFEQQREKYKLMTLSQTGAEEISKTISRTIGRLLTKKDEEKY